MRTRLSVMLLTALTAHAVIIDRIAVIAGNSIIKDSDIDRDIRVTDLLNGKPVQIDAASRKEAAHRLLDQIFIRREIQIGDYREATTQSADQQLDALKSKKFRTTTAYDQALQRAEVTDAELRTQFQWQLTVLNFIDARFKPAAYVNEEEIGTYFKDHSASLQKQFPGKSLADLQPEIRNTLAEEKVNQLFFAWLDEQRKNTKLTYLEESLR